MSAQGHPNGYIDPNWPDPNGSQEYVTLFHKPLKYLTFSQCPNNNLWLPSVLCTRPLRRSALRLLPSPPHLSNIPLPHPLSPHSSHRPHPRSSWLHFPLSLSTPGSVLRHLVRAAILLHSHCSRLPIRSNLRRPLRPDKQIWKGI